ncbi:iron complex outermembrane receptor protein [Desulfomicrobium macestii]|uniref:Iron complex outermembrane receptor protein n=1 Tax=Desulfomicrobium macestii TaxID=90731 RepID=A0ABR9H6B3_9BACT|nr:TonB-dependent receptor [Desulfomicrobium macestii]MBE1426239.1 iron complex outermembrane receptor protein [Desulfomicrobium macestii]
MRNNSAMALLLCVLWLFLGGEAFCEQNSTGQANHLGTITVTAQKKEENPQSVPISMDAFSEYQLQDAGIDNAMALTGFASNLHLHRHNAFQNLIVIRGISTSQASLYSPAGFYVDDICYPSQFMPNLDLYDIERAEVLKGPQGTLYGRNTESGVVNIVTRQPDDEIRAKVLTEYSSFNTVRTGASVSGPVLEDRLFLGAAGQFKSSDGFMDNQADGSEPDQQHLNGRGTLRWTPTSRWDISLIAEGMCLDDHSGGHRVLDGPQATDFLDFSSDENQAYTEYGNSQVLRARHKGHGYEVVSISTLMAKHFDKLNDADMTAAQARRRYNKMNLSTRQYSQEIRVSSDKDGALQWLVGLHGFADNTKTDFSFINAVTGKTLMNPVADIDVYGLALFGQATWTPVDKLHLTAGLRLDHQQMDGTVEDFTKATTCSDDLTYNEILPKAVIAYDVTPEAMTYLSVSKGYMTGGYNFAMTPKPDTLTFDPEYSWNYELGLKTQWLGGRLLANAALFYIDITDKQVMEYDRSTLSKTITNAAKAHSQGVEVQLQAKPAPGWDFFGSAGYNESRFDDFTATQWNQTQTALIEKDYSDNFLPNAPRYTYSLGAQYRSENGLFARADLLGSGRFHGDEENLTTQEAYRTVNLRLGYELDNWSLYLWGKNIFDEEYCTFISPFEDTTVCLDGEPRTVGVTLIWNF